ncbi:hypothetical protein RB595_004726 [Gaeumannomyces hyphopodioides]
MMDAQTRKRKLDKRAPKYYAVRTGYHPGVYLTWPECELQVNGYKGAQYKSFLTRPEAEAFVAGQNPGGNSDQTEKYYAVAVGNKPGVYTDWSEAQRAYAGVKGPKYRKFLSRAAAEEYVLTFGGPAGKRALASQKAAAGKGKSTAVVAAAEESEEEEDEEDDDDEEEEDDDDDDDDDPAEILQPVAKKQRTPTTTAAAASAPPKRPAPSAGGSGLTQIYTDGSSIGNGKVGAMAGVGVFFGDGDPRNISEPLARDSPQTNQRAELTAILRALQAVDAAEGVRILTDSKYSISCVTEWYRKWAQTGWVTSGGGNGRQPVKNADLVRAIRAVIDEREAFGAPTQLVWVKGHNNHPGNVAADALAVQGARMGGYAR